MASVTMRLDASGQGGRGPFGILRRRRAYLAVFYLLLAFPLSYIYAYTAVILVGILGIFVPPILLVVSLALTGFERWLCHWLLGVRFTPVAPPLPRNVSLWDRLQAHLRNPVTWKSIVYLIVRVSFGFVAAVVSAALLLASALLILAPVLYGLANVLYGAGYGQELPGQVPADWQSTLYQDPVYAAHAWLGIHGQAEPQASAFSLLLCALGILALVAVLHTLNGLASAWGWFAQQMLGVSPKDLALAEARAVAAEAHERAAQAEKGRRQLVLDASHELRTPVATIRAHIDSLLLLEGAELPEKVRAYLAVTQREIERLSALVDDLLMLARADADELRLDVRPVALGDLVEDVFRALEPLAERERQVTLVRYVAPDLPLAYADRDRLAQVLLNLARNAIAYTPAGGIVSIDLAAGEAAGTLTLTVTDTGMGIAEDDLAHIFERFYRTDASRARDTGGFGLGLSIVRDLVQAMGGAIAAERVPAGGSRFRVTLRAVTVA
jgi:two-component system phosphate regulon sensor histidine kinase PhoR